MKSAFLLEIPKRGLQCSHGNEPFDPGMEYFSTLSEEIEGNYVRRDYCTKCWDTIVAETNLADFRSYWKSKVPKKNVTPSTPIDREKRALGLIKELLNDTDDHAKAQCFVLALFLARKKWLQLRQELKLENGMPAILYEVVETEEMLLIPKVDLNTIQIEKVQQEIVAKINSDLLRNC